MANRISQQQLESYLWGAATLLRGTIDAGDYKQFIFPLLFYKRVCDVFDEETQAALAESGGDKRYAAGREQHRFQVPPEAHWREVRQAAKNVGAALQSAMRAIETANPDKLYGIFGDAQWTNKDRLSDAMLRDLESVRDDVETLVLDAQVLEDILKDADPAKRGREIEIRLVARLRKHFGNPKFTALGERLEKIKERHEQGFLNSLQFLKEILELAKEVLEAEKESDPQEERDRAKEALTELFKDAKEARQAAAVLPDAATLEKIMRYETKLERQMYRAMVQLERIQRMRQGEVLPAPLTVEVSERA